MPSATDAPPSILERVGRRVRERRAQLGLSGRELAARAGLSPRFVAQVEAGRGNIAIGRLERLAGALGTSAEALVAAPADDSARRRIERLLAGRDPEELAGVLAALETLLGERRPRVVALLGIRGAGKSAVGSVLARRLGLPFTELDRRIEEAAGLPAADIFSLHGEPYYRRLETRCLAALFASGARCVVALPGGVVGNDEAFEMVRRASVSVWLRATPEHYWARVLAQGDRRPIANRANAMADLRRLVAARAPLYARAALVADTSERSPDEVAAWIAERVDERLAPGG